MAHVLYRFYSGTGQLLYIGITMNPAQRFKKHRDTKDWWTEVAGISIENYESREDLANAERRAIRVEQPMYNITHTKRAAGAPVLSVAKPPLPPAGHQPPLPQCPSLADVVAFNHNWERQQRERESAEYHAKRVAVDQCDMCDDDGYRGMVVCDHVDRTGRARAALRRAQKMRLRMLKGGAA